MKYGVGYRLKYRYGGYAKIIEYRNENDIDFVFEDTGDIITHTTLHLFLMRSKIPPSLKKAKTYEEIKHEFDKNGYDLLSQSYVSAKSPLKYVCKKHQEFGAQTTTWNRIHYYGKICKYCSNENKKKVLREQKITVSYEDVEMFFKRTDVDLTLINSKSDFKTKWDSKILYICPNHPDIIQNKSFGRLLQEPYCALCHMKAVRGDTSKYHYADTIKIAETMGYEVVTKKEDYKNVATKIICRCPKHGEFNTTMGHLLEGRGCPICKESRGERKLREILMKHHVTFESQKRFDDLFGSNGGKLSYDFYLPSNNLLIEYQGEYHDGSVHKTAPYIQTIEDLERQQQHDILKRQYAQNNHIDLLEIWYFDYNKIEQILVERSVI